MLLCHSTLCLSCSLPVLRLSAVCLQYLPGDPKCCISEQLLASKSLVSQPGTGTLRSATAELDTLCGPKSRVFLYSSQGLKETSCKNITLGIHILNKTPAQWAWQHGNVQPVNGNVSASDCSLASAVQPALAFIPSRPSSRKPLQLLVLGKRILFHTAKRVHS